MLADHDLILIHTDQQRIPFCNSHNATDLDRQHNSAQFVHLSDNSIVVHSGSLLFL